MPITQTTFKRLSVISVVLALFFITTTAHAQVISQTPTDSSSFGSSSPQSDFQNAGFQQSGQSAATTGAGGADALKQQSTGPITVTGAPANQTVAASTKSNKLLISLITLASLTALALIALNLKKITKKQKVQEQVFEQEATKEAKSSIITKSTHTQLKPEEVVVAKPKKAKKPKKKNKKHHR